MRIFKIKNILRNLGHLQIEEKEWLSKNKAALFEFIKRYPVRESVPIRQPILARLNILKLTFKPMPIAIGVLIAALLAGGGTVYAAQGSLPGDALYPVKLVTEEVQTAITPSPEKKVQLEAKFANRRLEEIQKLQERVKRKKEEIKPEVVEKAMKRAEKGLERAQARIAKLEEGELKEKALEAASRLEEAFETHQQVLSELALEVPAPAHPALLRAQEVSARGAEQALQTVLRLEKVQEIGEKIQKRGQRRIVGAEERAEGKLKAMENKAEALENYLENQKAQGREVSAEAEAKLDEAKNKMEEARSLLLEKNYLEVFKRVHEAMRLMTEAKLLLKPGRPLPTPMPLEPSLPAPLPDEPTVLPAREPLIPESPTAEPTDGSGPVIMPLPEEPTPVETRPVEGSPVEAQPLPVNR